MNPASSSGREWLRAIARRAMLERGFEPDFPPDVVREANALHEPQGLPGGAVDDLRRLVWVSIDNDDSRDLDQLSVAEPLDGGRGRDLLVAVADVDALVKRDARDRRARADQHDLRLHAAEIFPMLPERLSTDLTSLNQDEDRLAVVVEMTVAAGRRGRRRPTSTARAGAQPAPSSPTTRVAAWLDGHGAGAAAVAAVPGLDGAAAPPGRRRAGA